MVLDPHGDLFIALKFLDYIQETISKMLTCFSKEQLIYPVAQ